MEQTDEAIKAEVFEHSYQEVLLALKHQDEKLNRTLTALAFLTVAGVALFPKITGSGVTFDGTGPGASAMLFVVFLVAVAVGVIVTLTAIGPGRPLPNPPRRKVRSARPPSLLFYARISRDDDWAERLDLGPAKLTKLLLENFHDEAKVIAARVDYKVTRSREANTWVQLAIVALALMGVFGADGLGSEARWWIAAALIIAVVAAPIWDLPIMQKTGYVGSGQFSPANYWILGGVLASTVSFLVLAYLVGAEWPALGYAAVAFVLPRYATAYSSAARALMIVTLLLAIPTLMLMLFLA